MTRTRWERWFGAGSDDCLRRRGSLSRYLDNDLHEREATAMAAHLRGCAACRAEFEAMRAQRAILSVGAIPRGAAGARTRVLNRFEEAVRAESARKTKRSRFGCRPLQPPVSRPAFAAVAATSLIALASGGTAIALRSMRPASPTAIPVAVHSAATPVPTLAPPRSLPQSGDLRAFFAQHDGSVTASTAREAPAAPRHVTHPIAATRAAPRHRSRIAANAPHSADSETAQTVSDEPTPIPSDEIPEAL